MRCDTGPMSASSSCSGITSSPPPDWLMVLCELTSNGTPALDWDWLLAPRGEGLLLPAAADDDADNARPFSFQNRLRNRLRSSVLLNGHGDTGGDDSCETMPCDDSDGVLSTVRAAAL